MHSTWLIVLLFLMLKRVTTSSLQMWLLLLLLDLIPSLENMGGGDQPYSYAPKKSFLTPQNFNFQLLRVNRGDWQQSYTVISSYIYTGRSDKRKLDNLQLCLLKFSALLKHNACFYSLSQFRLLYYLFWKQWTPHICLNSFIS